MLDTTPQVEETTPAALTFSKAESILKQLQVSTGRESVVQNLRWGKCYQLDSQYWPQSNKSERVCTKNGTQLIEAQWRAQNYLESVSWSVIMIVMSNLVMGIVEREPSGSTVKQSITTVC